MELRDYPELIAEKELAILREERHLNIDRSALEQAVSEIDRQVAFDDGLKNDYQRRARKQELLTSLDWYANLNERIQRADGEIRRLGIELGLLRNQFSIERLLLRERVALAEVANYPGFVGILIQRLRVQALRDTQPLILLISMIAPAIGHNADVIIEREQLFADDVFQGDKRPICLKRFSSPGRPGQSAAELSSSY